MKQIKSISFFSILLLILIITSCEKEKPGPKADFSYVNIGNQQIKFTNHSEYALTYDWTLGDGKSGSGENITHQYTTSGLYEVTLTAYGSHKFGNDGKKSTISKTIKVD